MKMPWKKENKMNAYDELKGLIGDLWKKYSKKESQYLLRLCVRVVEEHWQAYVKTEKWVTTEGNFLNWFADILEGNVSPTIDHYDVDDNKFVMEDAT